MGGPMIALKKKKNKQTVNSLLGLNAIRIMCIHFQSILRYILMPIHKIGRTKDCSILFTMRHNQFENHKYVSNCSRSLKNTKPHASVCRYSHFVEAEGMNGSRHQWSIHVFSSPSLSILGSYCNCPICGSNTAYSHFFFHLASTKWEWYTDIEQ